MGIVTNVFFDIYGMCRRSVKLSEPRFFKWPMNDDTKPSVVLCLLGHGVAEGRTRLSD